MMELGVALSLPHWGTCSLPIRLPFARILFTGLSSRQLSSLEQIYCHFIDKSIWDNKETYLTCQACRLYKTPALKQKEFVIDGLYAPKKSRNVDGIKITGYNFEAQIPLCKTGGVSSLGVIKEHELCRLDVIENFLRIFLAYLAPHNDGLILHSAGIIINGLAYIFPGRSNAGKTTLTRKAYKIGARVLSDDINLLLPAQEGYQAHAVPFTGEFGRTLDHSGGRDAYPVAAVILLKQGERLATETVSTADAVATLLTGCPFVNTDAEESSRLFDAVINLVAQVPVIRLISSRDDSIDDIMAAVTERLQSVAG